MIGGSSFTAGLVADTRVYSPISEISPALAADSGATNMQHMAIIKDFLIPGDTASASVTVNSPDGGESFAGGSAQSITWSASGVTNVKLEYTLNGSTWRRHHLEHGGLRGQLLVDGAQQRHARPPGFG